MKSLLHSIFLCLPFLSYSQIAFEYVPNPDDFSIGAVRKSPIGEYFVQAADDVNNIYTSLDGVKWTKSSLPVENELHDIQFYADGTPVLKPDRNAHLIRRNGNWYTMDAGGGDLVEASFIKGDTLFMYHDDRFAYSLDKGQTFTTVFIYDGNLIDHTAHLWKFDSYFVLHHTAGTQDRLSVFNLNGERVLSDTLDINFGETITYNSCGQILFNDEDNYYLIQEAGLTYQSGPTADIISPFGYNTVLLSEGGNYYFRNENTIYKTNSCNFAWQFYAANDLIESKEHIWFDHVGEIFLYDTYDDFFTVQTNGIAVEHYPDIQYPYIADVDESAHGYQFSLTANALFSKSTGDDKWIELDSTVKLNYQVQYSPGGDLYIARENDILYSTDNGHSFSTIPLPSSTLPIRNYSLKVLKDNVLFLISGIFGYGFYTLNNGQDWIDTGESFNNETPQAKLIGDNILIADINYELVFTKINVTTNETTSESFDPITGSLGSSATILDDGTFYIQVELLFSNDSEGYYRYRFGEGLKYLGPFPELTYATIASSGNDLYAFGSNDYYLYNGETFIEHGYAGLPMTYSKKFIVSENEYLYVIVDQNRIYRSTQPLSILTSTDETDALVDFNIFPNPANNELTLTIDESDLQRIDSYEIIDQLGRIADQSVYSNKQVINVAHLHPGYYNLMLKEKETVVGIKKFIKL